ncbi:MAG: hypothetical protein H6751_08630 [Candidatus Omnitrophica bacterium]|nr:hypothetical protein [Candidatus Omnitrophota bacterium]
MNGSVHYFFRGVVALMFLASGLPAEGSSEADQAPSKTSEFDPIQKEDYAKIPSFFYFDYKGDPQPGKRLWLRVDERSWIERYPNGLESRFKMVGRAVIKGTTGTIVVKVEGNPAKTLVPNDGRFQCFIADKESIPPVFAIRWLMPPGMDWRGLAAMKCVH